MLVHQNASYRQGAAIRQKDKNIIQTQAVDAINALQKRAVNTHDVYVQERLDRALDEVVRNPLNSQPAAFQIRSASANAAKVLKERRQVVSISSLEGRRVNDDGEDVSRREPGEVDDGYAVVDVALWVQTSNAFTSADRRTLQDLAVGHDAASIAKRDGLPVARVRERISRARRVARTAYAVDAA